MTAESTYGTTGTAAFAAPPAARPPQNDWPGRAELAALARSPALQRATRYLGYALLAGLIAILLLVATATVPVLFGYHTYNVIGGSMEPSLKAGSVAVTSPTSPRALQIGDVIAWRGSSDVTPVLHRVIDITEVDGQLFFITQGDQNATADPEPVALDGPGDKLVYSVPYAGYILSFAESGLGRAMFIGVPLSLLAIAFVRDARKRPGQMKEAGAGVAAAPAEQEIVPPLIVNEARARVAAAPAEQEIVPAPFVREAGARVAAAPAEREFVPALIVKDVRAGVAAAPANQEIAPPLIGNEAGVAAGPAERELILARLQSGTRARVVVRPAEQEIAPPLIGNEGGAGAAAGSAEREVFRPRMKIQARAGIAAGPAGREIVPPPNLVAIRGPQSGGRELPQFLVQQLAIYGGTERRAVRRVREERLAA